MEMDFRLETILLSRKSRPQNWLAVGAALFLWLCCWRIVEAAARSPPPPLSTIAPAANSALNYVRPGLPPVGGINVPPGVGQTVTGLVYQQITSLTQNITAQLQQQFSFCITDGEKIRNEVFSFNQNSTFLSDCVSSTAGTMGQRICLLEEVKLYFNNLGSGSMPPPNENCNISTWSQACESGWAASTLSNKSLNIDVVPSRLVDPRPCCAGFFCPKGLSCMIRKMFSHPTTPGGDVTPCHATFVCPLGAYCPLAKLNLGTGRCDPYDYQLTEGNPYYMCGGADKWADVSTSKSIFCPAGMYCPDTIKTVNCTPGHFCRLGSIQQDKCSHLTSCALNNLQKENLTGVGGLIIVLFLTNAILTITLLVMWASSDWLMDIQKRQKAKAREVAQRQARERVSGLERWKQGKETAKQGAMSFTRKLSRGVSRKRHSPQPIDELPILNGHPASSEYMGAGSVPSSGLMVKSIDENGSTQGAPLGPIPLVPYSSETNYDSDLYAPLSAPPILTPDLVIEEPSGHNCKNGRLKGKRPTSLVTPLGESQSEILAYAYGQIEKERAFGLRRQTPTMKEVDFMEMYGGQVVGRMRPPIELSFFDLSLILKGSKRKILSNVTGALLPGRITAVMGPSGAGKTTFLNALAGKATHSQLTGEVLINGKPDSIQSYKSIIGFVPQDDIVQGNLTVEENLWFSASYRLPLAMPKCDRVLVVERIIAALGLGSIRDAMVGTVEKRGISGGQRKRVNVGLEMVMEPSLLILDEPTSGLDSTSSRLVLQALRREANVGVNVGVVLHQPSYGLFKMFDDVMFLAKGGRTVYLGPVAEVENYFAGLGLVVPDRISPPDHFMDALEGIVTPPDHPEFDPKSLPVLWMINKGYNIPPDLMDTAAELQSGQRSAPKEPRKTTTFLQEVWEELKMFLTVQFDLVRSLFHRVDNKLGRQTPGFFAQFRIIIRIVAKQRFREARIQFQDYIILLVAGACVGVLSNMRDINLGSGGYFYSIIALALLIMIASLRTFSNDKLTFWRESASGINRVAYFLAKDVVDLFNVVIKPLIYLSMFYFFSNPRSTFTTNFIVTIVLVYCVTGIAYICAILLQPAPAQLWSVFLPILATLIVTAKRTGFMLILTYLSYARYANEAYVIANASRYTGVWIITRCGMLEKQGYKMTDWVICLIVLFVYGVVVRLIALMCLFMSNRSRQK